MQLCDAFLENLGRPCLHSRASLFSPQSEGTRNPRRNKCFMTTANRSMVQVVFRDVYLFTYNKFLFIIFIIFPSSSFCLCVCVFVCECMYMLEYTHMHTHRHNAYAGDQGDIGYPEIEVIGIFFCCQILVGTKSMSLARAASILNY